MDTVENIETEINNLFKQLGYASYKGNSSAVRSLKFLIKAYESKRDLMKKAENETCRCEEHNKGDWGTPGKYVSGS